MKHNVVLSIAGSDPSGGAGIQADIKTMSALGCYAAAAITAVVDENTCGVEGVHVVPAEFGAGQVRAVMSDIDADAGKIGMLGSAEVAEAVAEALRQFKARNVVLDPVLVATSGDALTERSSLGIVVGALMPLSTIITPNIPEAEALLSALPRDAENAAELPTKISDVEQMKAAAKALARGCAVLLKGGHLPDTEELTDIFYDPATGQLLEFPAPRVATRNTHGTGCTLSSAIASKLAKGCSLLQAVVGAKEYINGAIAAGAKVDIGKGKGPVHHFYDVWK